MRTDCRRVKGGTSFFVNEEVSGWPQVTAVRCKGPLFRELGRGYM